MTPRNRFSPRAVGDALAGADSAAKQGTGHPHDRGLLREMGCLAGPACGYPPHRQPGPPWLQAIGVWLVLAALGLLPVQADEPPPRQPRAPDVQERLGRFVRISAPITDRVENRVRRIVDATINDAKKAGQWPVLIFEIQPGRTEFGQALDLARYLSSPALNGATTIAYLPETVTGHMVLVAMACDEIIMAAEAELGEAGKYEEVIEPSVRNAYVEIANRRKKIPADVALGMLDPAVEVLQVETDMSRRFVLSTALDELRKKEAFQTTKVLKPAGKPGLFTGRQLRELDLVSFVAADRADVAKIWKLPRESIEDDPALAGDWRPVRVYVKGPISSESAGRLQNLLRTQLDDGVNFICLWMDSPGGDPAASLNLANYLTRLDPAKVRTVAYIPGEARGDAAFIALACDHVVMHPSAHLGGAGAADIGEQTIPLTVQALEEIARAKLRSPALLAALVDPNLAVYRCSRKTDGLIDFFTDAQLQRLKDAELWRKEGEVTHRGHVLRVDGAQAEELHLATSVVENFTEFKTAYGLENDPQLVEPGWAATLIDALKTPAGSLFLLFLGAAAIYAELQSPGIGLGGIIGALCFLLYFWAAYLGGTAGWLEVLLFGAGIVCLLLEVFVFPGVTVFGVVGGLLVVVSLVLASQTFVLPRNEYQFAQLRTSLTVLAAAGVATVAAAVALNRLLPHAPMFNRMLLKPPSGEELTDLSRREALAQFEHLVGAQGVAVTPLLPSGKARFGEELVDVLADGEFIEKGQRVVVVQARGHRVVVRATG